MRGCNQFADVPALRTGVSTWLRDRVWGVQPETGAASWFEECRDKLLKAFGVACLDSLPFFLPRPGALNGALPAAVRVVTPEIDRWAGQTRHHLKCLRKRASADCQAQTKDLWDAFDLATTRLIKHNPMSSNPSGKAPLCKSFLAWADLFFLWSVAYEQFERALAGCFGDNAMFAAGARSPDAASASADALTRERLVMLQISPVPWPPWPGAEIPDTSSVAS